MIAIGDVLDGKYEITDILGEGAMGVVYLALHTRLQRMVAVKTLRAEIAGDAELVARFEREARAASAIGHANIVQVFDAGGAPVPYLVMESLIGSSLGELLEAEGTLGFSRARDICIQVLAGLEAAHSAGIVHRDLKPDNIFVSQDASGTEVVKILDFGISKILDKADPAIALDSKATRAGMVMGTPLYMSPEQASGRHDLDHRTDLWALACVLYECVTGATPFTGDNYNQILAAVLGGNFVSLSERCGGQHKALSQLIERALDRDCDARFSCAAAFRQALETIDERGTSLQGDDKMLAAFDNLADRFLEQEKQVAPPVLATENSNSRSAGRRTPAPRLRDDRFAPPESMEPMSLALEVERSPRSTGRALDAAPTPARSGKPVRSHIVTRRESRSLVSRLIWWLLVIVLLAGAGAGYRYYSKGYLTAPASESKASLQLTLDPTNASVFLDGKPQSSPSLQLEAGADYQLRVRAEGRLAYQQDIAVQPGFRLHATLRLATRLPSITARKVAFTRSAPVATDVSAEVIDAGFEKLRSLSDCGARLSKAAADLADDEDGLLPRALVDECVLSLTLRADEKPPMQSLDEASRQFAVALADFDKAARTLKSSIGASRKLLRDRRVERAAANKRAIARANKWEQRQNESQAQWLMAELALVRNLESASMHALLRELAVLSDSVLRMHLAGGVDDDLRKELHASYERAEAAAKEQPELYEARGGGAFLRAMKPLIAGKEGEDPLFWHNQAIQIFNELVLPIEITSAPSPLEQ